MKSAILKILNDSNKGYLYAAFFIILFSFLFLKIETPSFLTPSSKDFYDNFENLDSEKPIFISVNYDNAFAVEMEPSLVSVFRHALRKNIKIIVVSLIPQGAEMAQRAFQKALKHKEFKTKKIVYGKDFVNLGYLPGGLMAVKSISYSIQDAFEKDFFNNTVSSLELIKKTNNLSKVSAIIDISSALIDNTQPVLFYSMVKNEDFKHTKLFSIISGAYAAETHLFQNSGQITAFLAGIKGAADYEILLGKEEESLKIGASAVLPAISAASIFVLLIIISANIGSFLSKKNMK